MSNISRSELEENNRLYIHLLNQVKDRMYDVVISNRAPCVARRVAAIMRANHVLVAENGVMSTESAELATNLHNYANAVYADFAYTALKIAHRAS